MDTYFTNIKRDVLENTDYRRVVYTLAGEKGVSVQVVLMSVDAGEDIRLETHPHTTQILQIFEGLCIAEIGYSKSLQYSGSKYRIRRGRREDKNIALGKHSMLIIPPNTFHRVQNMGTTPLKLCSIYVPPEHPQNTVQKTRPF